MERIDRAIDYRIYNVFSDTGLPSNWIKSLLLGVNYIFDNDTIVSIVTLDDKEIIINSVSKRGRFPLAALLFILKTIKNNPNKNIYISSINDKVIERLTNSYGFKYDNDKKCLYRIKG